MTKEEFITNWFSFFESGTALDREKMEKQLESVISQAIAEHEASQWKLYELIAIHEEPYFRKMRVEGGWVYNFYNCGMDNYNKEWIFVPDPYQPTEKGGEG